MKDTYYDIESILLDNGIPHYIKKEVSFKESKIYGIEVFDCGITLDKKEQIVKKLLRDIPCKISAANETVRITL